MLYVFKFVSCGRRVETNEAIRLFVADVGLVGHAITHGLATNALY